MYNNRYVAYEPNQYRDMSMTTGPYQENYQSNGDDRFIAGGGFALPFLLGTVTGPLLFGGGYRPQYQQRPYPPYPYPPRPYPPYPMYPYPGNYPNYPVPIRSNETHNRF